MSKIQQTNIQTNGQKDDPANIRALTLPFDSDRHENAKGEFETTLFIPTECLDDVAVSVFFKAVHDLNLGLTDGDVDELLNSARETGMVRKLVRSIVRGS